ncbi:MAG TPA: hypothetical protein VNJ08_06425 [Bacteriovoracaceae bacterium]|nr:hypothetical protein [Bacteriovoracaceae bacterium]
MQKYNASDVKTFEFSDLKGDHVVAQPKFENFNFNTIEGKPFNSQRPSDETIRKERSFEKNMAFQIDGQVRNSRGLAEQEKNDLESTIENEVDKRLAAAYKQAYEEGLQRGLKEGHAEALMKFEGTANQKLEALVQVLDHVQNQSAVVVEKNHKEIRSFIKRFTKWIILKEVNEKTYLEGLLEKLVLELNARRNLIIKVGKNNFAQMPEVLSAVETKLGALSNVRIEIVTELSYPGIILESENGLIDGSLEGVFKNIDKIFEQVNGNE